MYTAQMLDLWSVLGPAIGSGFATTAVGWLFQRRVARELELHKALLQRASQIHERQVNALMDLYGSLYEAHGYLQRISSSGHLSSEKVNEYPKLFSAALLKAGNELTRVRLLLPPEIVAACDRFFSLTFESTLQLGIANHPATIAAGQRPQFWDKAATIAYKEIPTLLQSIEAAARKLIHGEDSAPTAG